MTRILLRAHKSPFRAASATETISKRLIGSNVGNLMFSHASCRLLSVAGAEITTSKFERLDPREVNENYDVAVVPLANAFRASLIDGVRDMAALFEKLTIPVVVLGVGAQGPVSGEFQASELDDVVKRFMRAVLDRSGSVGVRGELTAKYLANLGFGEEHVRVIGCPSLFLRGPQLEIVRKVEELTPYSRISLNVSPYRPLIGPISLDHAKRYPNLMYTAQDQRTLGLMLNGVFDAPYALPEGSPTSLDHPLIRDNRVRFCLDPSTWMDYLSTFDFSFGTRIHGTIAALLGSTPGLLLAHDSRTLELATYHQIPYRVLNRRTSEVDATRLYAKADWGPTMSGHAERWERMASFLASHDLRHVYLPGESPDAFDAKLASVEFPPPVQMGMRDSLEKLYEMQRRMPELRAELKRVEAAQAAARPSQSRTRKLLRRAKRRVTGAVQRVTGRS
ncbi:polysaccharide pyruvyl transferase family protein [Propionicimonas sp.]|uniref:polysaccharide pyruvyl transferase family protein n=1 Tax=Propionicimonas sp. TaxID=1955623 RepID=UPI0039E38199